MRRIIGSAVAVVAVIGTLLVSPATAAPDVDTTALQDAVTVDGIREHQQELQEIADANGGTRASGTPGYDASVDYVVDTLEAAGYQPVVQEFEWDFFEERATPEFDLVAPSPPAPKVYVQSTDGIEGDFATMDYSGSGEVTEPIVPTNDIVIPPGNQASTSDSGCEEEDFADADFTGAIALIQRGTCDFIVKALNAEAAGAVGVIIFNEGQPGRDGPLLGTLGGPGVTIPVIGTSFAVGEELYELAQAGETIVHIFTETFTEPRTTFNVLADTSGRPNSVVVVGAHLDSVLAGPGINDNGSGSATILEIAEAIADLEIETRNTVRFAWWGAEESGLVGSEHYVTTLSSSERNKIALNLNFDMVGSPNYVRFVYDGDGSDTATAGPKGSAVIEQVFLDYFEEAGLETEPTAFDGRSDYGPFIDVGIPAGGLFTGAEGIKTEAEADVYGGTEGQPYDPCYHQACDTFENVSLQALDEMSNATAHATLVFAMWKGSLAGPG
jgi:Zn-dependent M28 family amino/carboxypeptidase